MNIELCPKCLTPLQTNGVCMLCNYRAPYAPSLELDLDEVPDEPEEMQSESWNSGEKNRNTQSIPEELPQNAEEKTASMGSEREQNPGPAVTRSIPYMMPRIYKPKTEIEKGDHVLLGEFSKAPIEWRVLEVKDGKALLFSEYVLKAVRYHNERWADVTWASSDLRDWLNGEFYETVFNDAEKAVILTTQNTNEDNPYFNTPGGDDTADKVFLLSFAELQKFFEDYEYIGGFSSDNCQWGDEILNRPLPFGWWTRTPGAESHMVLVVDECWDDLKHADGVSAYSLPDDICEFLRPAIWIDAKLLEEQVGKIEEIKEIYNRMK